MADVKLTDLPVATTASPTAVGMIVDSNVSEQITVPNMVKAGLPSLAGNDGKVLSTTAGNLEWVDVGGTGTVTSVGVSGGTTGLTVTGSPVTAAGTMTIGGTLGLANGGTGAVDAAGARTALGVPSTGGTGATGTWGISVTGTAQKATNIVGGSSGQIPVQTGITTTDFIPVGGEGQVLTMIGGSPAWSNGTTQLKGKTDSNAPYQTVLGANAGGSNTGANNTILGYNAAFNTTTLSDSVVIGTNAVGTGVATSVAAGTTAIGANSMQSLVSGVANTAVGYNTAKSLTAGNYNTVMGYEAGLTMTGSQNTIIGASAGDQVTNGGSNTFLGAYAGTQVSSGVGNTFVGANAGTTITTGSNNTFIGRYTGTITQSNCIALSDGVGTVRQFFNSFGAMAFSNLFDYGEQGEVLRTYGSNGLPYWDVVNKFRVLSVGANMSLTAQYGAYFVNCTASSITLTLPPASSNTGATITVKRIDSTANNLNIASSGGKIEGGSSSQIGVMVAVTFCSDGTDWWELANG